MSLKERIARIISPASFIELEKAKADFEAGFEMKVNSRVADILFKMDPFEPLIKKYNIVFSGKWADIKPEDELDSMGAMRLFMWAYGTRGDPNFIHLMDWIRNRQGNATVQKGKNEEEWFFGRASLATLTLLIEEVGRLSSKYEEVMASRNQKFDAHLPVGEY